LNAAANGASPSADALLRKPTFGMVSSCARAASGHAAAALPSNVMKSRRLILGHQGLAALA